MIANKFIAALVLLPFFAQFALADCSRQYTVQAGDICDSISAAHNVSTYQLATVNAAIIDATCSNLTPGEVLCLGNTGEDCSTTHLVVAGDDCDIIATAAGINTTILYQNNPQINSGCTNIYIGEVLCISPQVQVPPAPSQMPASTIPATASAPVASTPSSAPVVSPSPPPTPTPTPTPTPSTSTSASSSASPPASSPAYSDLPYCDEL